MEECTHSHQASWASALALLRGDAVGQYISDLNITAVVAYSGRIGWSSESGASSHRETLWATAVFKDMDINAAVAYSSLPTRIKLLCTVRLPEVCRNNSQ